NAGAWATHHKSHYFAFLTHTTERSTAANGFAVLDTSRLFTNLEEGSATPFQYRIFKGLEAVSIVGLLRSTIFFLDLDHWVCSINAKRLDETTSIAISESGHGRFPLPFLDLSTRRFNLSRSGEALSRDEQSPEQGKQGLSRVSKALGRVSKALSRVSKL
ncbi:hypothetical protein QBC40DRAFT_238837, partial [Triangularia verruculosa]